MAEIIKRQMKRTENTRSAGDIRLTLIMLTLKRVLTFNHIRVQNKTLVEKIKIKN